MKKNSKLKSAIPVIFFLIILTILDFSLRKGLFYLPIPIPLPSIVITFLFFTLFTVLSWFLTKWFSKKDGFSLSGLGISLSNKNRIEFFYGLIIGIFFWALVSIIQSFSAGFSWELRPNISLFNLLYGLIFIFIADLGTELFTRAYPLNKLKNSFGENIAIILMVFFVGLKSISFNLSSELLFYSMLIPAIHTVFFSMIYLKTKRLGAALGIHTGANFVTISIFDLRIANDGQAIPSGIFQANKSLESLSMSALQLPWVIMALIFCIIVFFWWRKN